jgi:hypothetical protein
LRPRWRSTGRRRSTPHPLTGRSSSGGWRRGDFLASRGMGEAQGKKVEPPPLRLRRSRHSRPSARSSQREAVVARRTASSGDVVANLKGPAQEHRHIQRKDGGHVREKGRNRLTPTGRRQRISPAPVGSLVGASSNWSRKAALPVASRQTFTAPIFANLFDDGNGRRQPWSCSRPPAGE